jgi:hypothetical protein
MSGPRCTPKCGLGVSIASHSGLQSGSALQALRLALPSYKSSFRHTGKQGSLWLAGRGGQAAAGASGSVPCGLRAAEPAHGGCDAGGAAERAPQDQAVPGGWAGLLLEGTVKVLPHRGSMGNGRKARAAFYTVLHISNMELLHPCTLWDWCLPIGWYTSTVCVGICDTQPF